MARLDSERECLVVRIVYDGTALSGKTTTVRALGASLVRDVETPVEEAGRTLYFDWLDYTGGRFDGFPIRCQIVTVPGQAALARRREKLIEDADAVVFVADTSADGYGPSLEALGEAIGHLGRRSPPVGLVVQANQRDRADAVPIETVRADCAALSKTLAVTESSALTGYGVRETFVLAVRLALDRVRELKGERQLEVGRPDVDDAVQLLAALRAADASAGASDAPGIAERTPETWERRKTPRPASEGSFPRNAPWPPDASVPSGLIWPPMTGRMILHDWTERSIVPIRLGDGSWGYEEPAWRLRSDLEDLYFDFDEGRAALIEWARHHAALGSLLSSRRAIVLARAAPGAWRLWQLVARLPSLEAEVAEAIAGGATRAIASSLLGAAKKCLDFEGRFAGTPIGGRASLADVVIEDGTAVFGGLFPRLGQLEERSETSAGEILRRYLGEIVKRFVVAAEREKGLEVTVGIRRLAEQRGWPGIGEVLCRLFPSA